MKNLILPIALATILFTSCSKDDSLEQTELLTSNSVYVLNQMNENTFWDTIEVDELERSTNYLYDFTAQTNGSFVPTSRNGMYITWSGTQNENGGRGSAEIKQESPNSSFHFILETECVTAEGNEAVYGGIITKVKSLRGNTPNISVGWRFYFKVIDNGDGFIIGGIIPNDQISNTTMFASPSSPSLCGAYLPNNIIWSSQGYTEVTEPGFVVVRSNEND